MKRTTLLVAATSMSLLLAACQGNTLFSNGSSASPPTDVKVVAGDSRVTVTWTAASNVDYWLFYAPGASVTPDNWGFLGGKTVMNASSPTVVTGLTNGTTYSFTVNGRIDKGPGGAGSTAIAVVPRLAGGIWTAGALLGNSLNGAAYGSAFVAVGDGGVMYSSTDGMTWKALTNPAAPSKLNAAIYGGIYVAAGANGVILYSSDATTWTQAPSNPLNEFTALAGSGAGYLAVGKAGVISTSSNGQTWTAPTTLGGGVNLNGAIYGNSKWVVVGDAGTILTSADALTWTAVASGTPSKLTSVTYGLNAATGAALFVATGAAGALLTSADGVTWTARATPTTNNLNSVVYGRQFIAAGDSGTVLTSTDGVNWQAQTSGTVGNLNAIAFNAYGYTAVGASGTNLTAY